jgi:exodeoxyribonuclease V beta subunit
MAKDLFELLKLDQHAVIEASAGTGKTYTIENLVVRMLIDLPDLSIEEILIVTYTEKAAGELRTRIRQGITNAIQKETNTRIKNHLRKSLGLLETAGISTIHGFCKKVLATWSFESDISLGQEIVDDSEGLNQEVRKLIRSRWKQEYGDQFQNLMELLGDKGKKDFAENVSAFALKMSAPEVELMPNVKDVPELLQEKKVILNKMRDMAPGLLKRFKDLRNQIPDDKKKPVQYCDQAIKALSNFIETDNFEVDFLEAHRVVSGGNSGIRGASLKHIHEECDSIYQDYEPFWNFFESVTSIQTKLLISFLQHEARVLSDTWKQRKVETGGISFDDMIRIVREALFVDDSILLKELRSKYKFGIIDEFQDTNPDQWDIFRMMFPESGINGGKLFVVGDPKQSIYKFQGADVGTYTQAKSKMIQEFSAQKETLDRNFRSTDAMIKAYNLILKTGDENWFLNESISYENEVQSGLNPENSAKKYSVNPEFKKTGEYLLNHPIICYEGAETNIGIQRYHYAQWCADQIELLIQNEQSPIFTEKGKLQFGDIAFLVSARNYAIPVLNELRKRNIPASFYKQEGIFQSAECLQFITLLKAVSDPGHMDKNILTAMLSVFFSRNASELAKLDRYHDDQGHFNWFDEWQALAFSAQWSDLVNSIYKRTKVELKLALDEEGERKVANLKQITQHFLEHCISDPGNIKDHILWLESLYSEESSTEGDQNLYAKETESSRVQMMTIHASKGLEFPVVFLVPSNDPSPKIKDNWVNTLNFQKDEKIHKQLWFTKEGKGFPEADLKALIQQEKMRLTYVALTRAGCRLYVPIWSEKNGGVSKDPVSQRIALALSQQPKNSNLLTSHKNYNPPNFKAKSTTQGSEGFLTWEKAEEILCEFESELHPPENFNLRKRTQTSFSALAHNRDESSDLGGRIHKDELLNEDVLTAEIVIPGKYPDLPSGAATGNIIHEVLEIMDFKEATKLKEPDLEYSDSLKTLIYEKINRHSPTTPPIQELRFNSFLKMISETLNTYVPLKTSIQMEEVTQIKLINLSLADRKAEAEFHFTFDRNGLPFPSDSRDTAGYVLGYIDLIFRVPVEDGGYRYHVLDWKSNTLSNYEQENLEQCMRSEGYELQAALYTLALDQWLSKYLGDAYDPKIHLGLPCYVFTRGCEAETSKGIWTPEQTSLWKNQNLMQTVQDLIKTGKSVQSILHGDHK